MKVQPFYLYVTLKNYTYRYLKMCSMGASDLIIKPKKKIPHCYFWEKHLKKWQKKTFSGLLGNKWLPKIEIKKNIFYFYLPDIAYVFYPEHILGGISFKIKWIV